jgi:hypothetical protein
VDHRANASPLCRYSSILLADSSNASVDSSAAVAVSASWPPTV